MSDPRSLFEKIKILQEKTGLAFQVLRNALEQSQRDIDQSILWLKKNKLLPYLTKEDIIGKCAGLANDWAEDFLASTQETGELFQYYSTGRVHVIRDNFFSFYVAGVPERDPFLIFKDDLKLLTEDEENGFSTEIKELYENAVDRLLPQYTNKTA